MNAIEHLESNLWQHPSNYMGATWEGYYVLCGQSRDSSALERSNFTCFEEILSPWKEHVVTIRERHWACGWVEWLGLRPNAPQEAKQAAGEVLCALAAYPVISDEHFSEIEEEEALQTWQTCYNEKERVQYIRKLRDPFDFSSFAALRCCIRGDYFCGYASELLY